MCRSGSGSVHGPTAGSKDTIIDFAPGISNVVRRMDGRDYYAVELFHTSEFYNTVTPVFSVDLSQRVDLAEVYGLPGLRARNEGVILLNNHPLRRVRLVGTITQCLIKEYESSHNTKNGTVWYFLHLDDSSGGDIVVKIVKNKILGSGVKDGCLTGLLVSVTGLTKVFNDVLELQCESLEILNDGKDDSFLKEQIQFWKEALQTRSRLQRNWVQLLQVDDGEARPISYKPPIRNNRITISEESSIHTDTPDPLQIESSIYIQKQRLSRSTPPPSIQWVPSTEFNPPTTHLPFSLQLAITLIKWLIKNKEAKVNLTVPFQNPEISKILDNKARQRFPLQTVSLTQLNIKSVFEIKADIFHESRTVLHKMNLVLSDKRGKTADCTHLLRLYSLVLSKCDIDKSISAGHFTLNEILYEEKLNINYEIAEVIIAWMVKRSRKCQNWAYNKSLQQWKYFA